MSRVTAFAKRHKWLVGAVAGLYVLWKLVRNLIGVAWVGRDIVPWGDVWAWEREHLWASILTAVVVVLVVTVVVGLLIRRWERKDDRQEPVPPATTGEGPRNPALTSGDPLAE